MKGFYLDKRGDVVIAENDIVLTADLELKMQKIHQVLSTNQGEWWLDEQEGIPMQKVLKKNPNLGLIRDYIKKAILQVDSELQLESCEFRTEGRTLLVDFTVSDSQTSATMQLEV